MPQMIVTVNKLNRRSSPVVNVADKSNIIDTVSKGYSFESTDEITNKAGSWYKDVSGNYYWAGGVTPKIITLPNQSAENTGNGFSLQQLQSASGARNIYAQKFMPFINDTCRRYEINSPVRGLCFFAQTGHESGGLFYTEELDSGNAYEGRKDLGNIEPGDGVRYKGRGLIQITGRANYSVISNELEVDFVSSPSFLGGKNADQCTDEQLKNAALSAGWYWNRHNINSIADKISLNSPIEEKENLDSFIQITRVINGGTNGLNDRVARYKAGLHFFL